jgi:hypothetical protein
VIVRIQGEGQYELGDDARTKLDELDGRLFGSIRAQDAAEFSSNLSAVVGYVESHGTRVADDRLVSSDFILPAPDTSLEEAQRLLTDEGFLEPVEA